MRRLSFWLVVTLLVAGCGPASQDEATAFSDGTGGEGAASVTWLTDFGAAKRAAAERQVPILADFSGSDWCGWCKKLDREVFSQAAFTQYAAGNLVLFLADFPRGKEQTDEVKAQNSLLAKEYGVQGFPTVLLLDADGNELARTGYRKGGPEEYVAHLNELATEAVK